MSQDYYGAGKPLYRNSRLEYSGSVSAESARGKTPASGFDQAFVVSSSNTTLIPMRRVIIRNLGSNAVTVKIRTIKPSTGIAHAEGDAGGPITIPAGDSLDTYGMMKNISDVMVTAVNTDVVEIFQMPMTANS